MNKWVLLEHKVYFPNSVDIFKQQNHRLVWLSRIEHELSENRGFVKRIDHGMYKNVSNKLDSEYFQFILDGKLLYGLFEISGNSCRLRKNY